MLLKVGEIDVMVISDGVLPLPGALLGHNADPAVRAAWLKDKFLSPDVFDWALNVVVVRSGGRTILIDAGLGMDPDLDLPQAGKLAQRLQAAGIDLASVTDVVLTICIWTTLAGCSSTGCGTGYEMYPPALKSPYGERRSAFGKERYSTLGIAREDWEARQRAAIANWNCFGAPAALWNFFTQACRMASPPRMQIKSTPTC